jgi:hypothetical protein
MNPLLASALLLLGLSFFAWTMSWRLRAMASLRPDPSGSRLDRPGERLAALLTFGFGQRRMVDREEFLPGLMHVLIFGAFLTLALRTVMLFVMGFSDSALDVLVNLGHPQWAAHPSLRSLYGAYLLVKDFVALGALAGVGYFAYLRVVVKPARLTQSNEALLILGFIGALMGTEFLFGAEHLRTQDVAFSATEPVTSLVGWALAWVPSGVLSVR